MSEDPKSKKNPGEPATAPFTNDHSQAVPVEVPSISMLLARKKTKHAQPSSKSLGSELSAIFDAPVAQPIASSEGTRIGTAPASIAIEIDSPALPAQAPPPTLAEIATKPRLRAAQPSRLTPDLIRWSVADLLKSKDPMAEMLARLIGKGFQSGCFLAIQAPAPGSLLPVFASTAAFGKDAPAHLWTGLKWDGGLLPDLWKAFVETGTVELPPPGIETTVTSSRNVTRAAFGVDGTDYLTMIRIGSKEKCRGVLALVSSGPMIAALTPYLSALHSGRSVQDSAA